MSDDTATMRQIVEHVARRHGLTFEHLASPSRRPRLAHARQEAMWLMRRQNRWSLPAIGRFLHRDHTTVLHAVRAHDKRLAERNLDPDEEANVAFAPTSGVFSPPPAPVRPRSVYVIAERDGHVKVGVSDTPRVRLLELQTSNPRLLELVYSTAPAPRKVAVAMERAAHAALAARRLQGEWFSCSAAEAVEAVKSVEHLVAAVRP